MNWLADNYGSLAGVDGPEHMPALAFTADDMLGWTEEDHEAAALAMDRDMADRMESLRIENAALAADKAWLEGKLRDYEDGETDAPW